MANPKKTRRRGDNRRTKPQWVTLQGSTRVTEMALRLLARASDGRLDPAGSAVMLGDTMAVTARHVVQDYWDKLDGRPLTSGLTSTFELVAVRGLRDCKRVVVYLVEGFTLSPTSDLAVLFLRPRGPVPSCALPILDLIPPAVGATIVGVGFHSGTARESDGTIAVNHQAHTSSGRVIKVEDERRDNFSHTFPCFQVDARFDGGMSGGPVFDERGLVCGIICSNMPPFSPDEEHVSYVTTLWPLMALQAPRGPNGTHVPLRELAASGQIRAEGWRDVELLRDGDAIGCRVTYSRR